MSHGRHVMTISRNGQVSIPAGTRARWQAHQVVVVDLGDRVVIRPLPDDPLAALVGKYRRGGSSSDQARRHDRTSDLARERHR